METSRGFELNLVVETNWIGARLSAAVARAPCEVGEDDDEGHEHEARDSHQAGRGDWARAFRLDAADGSDGEYQLTASGVVQFYYNPFALNGGLRIPIRIHPKVPPGTVIGWAENLPIQYQSNEVPNVAEIKTRQDYYQIDWPIVTRQRQIGVYAEEVLAVYAPFAMGVICNIANG